MKRLLLILLALTALSAPALAFQPGNYDIVIQAGEDYQMTAVEANNGTPVNLAGNTYAAQCSSAAGGIVFANYSAYASNPAAGAITVKLSAAQSAKLAGKTGVWWLKRTDAAGLVSYRLAGKCVVVPR